MKIIINTNFSHETAGTSNPSTNSLLKKMFDKIFFSENKNEAQWVNDKEVVLHQEASPQLHSFLLKAEELGKNIEYSRQTVIKIKD